MWATEGLGLFELLLQSTYLGFEDGDLTALQSDLALELTLRHLATVLLTINLNSRT